ncbi:baseplate J/gp47 family protein [Chitinophagaceae bacterium MMS25-I14]
MACDDKKNPLQRGGTSQLQRMPNGLKAGYVNVDERSFAGWIVFADAFAPYINYFNATNKIAGDWKPFFDNDVSAILGSVAILDVNEYQQSVKARFDVLKSDGHQSDAAFLKENFGALFSCILSLSKALDGYLQRVPVSIDLRYTIQNLVVGKLQPALSSLLAYYKGAQSLSLIAEKDFPDWKVLNTPVQQAGTIITAGLSQIWIDGSASWSQFYADITEDESIYGTGTTVYQKINHAVNHNLFAGLFDQFLSAYARIVQDAETQLLQTLTDWDNHPSHYALFLTFLKLFRFSQDNINTLTQRHLDFYYKEVLQLKPGAEEPDHVHLLVELAKQTDTFLLKQGSLLKAGKDSTGKEVVYAVDKDTVINKAAISGLMAWYKGSNADNYKLPDNITVNNAGRMFASPVVNSADGLGAEIKTPNKEWHPFINKQYAEGALTAVTMPNAAIGFAVASPYLLLSEGERIVNVKIVTASGSVPFASSMAVEAYATTAKGWFKITRDEIKIQAGTTVAATQATHDACTVLSFTLPGDAPSVVNYLPAVHGGAYDCTTPLVKFILLNDNSEAYTYDTFKNITVKKAEVEVKVGMDNSNTLNDGGLRKLFLSNDVGSLDPAKPFLPFAQSPRKGASFTVGHEELAKKPFASFKMKFIWTELPGTAGQIDYDSGGEGDTAPKVTVQALAKGRWGNILSSEAILNGTAASIEFPSSLQPLYDTSNPNADKTTAYTAYEEAYAAYNVSSRSGFVRLMLNAEFGYDMYNAALNKFLTGASATDPGGPPYVPKLQSVTLHYMAAGITDLTQNNQSSFDQRVVQFFHVYPFGEAEQHIMLNSGGAVKLMPQFNHAGSGGTEEHVGEFYVGLKQLKPDQSVQVLFQVLEGSSNPLLDKPDKHVTWSYLSGNMWKLMDTDMIQDATLQLVQSGIISFVVPDDATTAHTVMPAGLIWFRASVDINAEAVCKLLSVDAQAISVSFSDQGNAADFLAQPLPAGTISKLKIPDASVKKITQPYPSSDGKPVETGDHFYIRVSERLRHKSRAITIWDYERLVLEAFPEIYRVKCLNHTKYVDNDYNEVAPGYVTIITIPSLINRNDVNPLQPYTNQSTLSRIEAFLRQKISCHVTLNVRQPLFEEVLLSFKLKLYDGLEFSFYSDQLKREITEFLTPWAFGKSDDVLFGGQVSKSVLINFIEERSYVDYITDVQMFQRINNVLTGGDQDLITASTGRSILVSVPASQHNIVQIVPVDTTTTVSCTDTWTGPPVITP